MPSGFRLRAFAGFAMENFSARPPSVPLCVSTDTSKHADDHQMYHSGNNQEEVTSKLISASVNQATSWYKPNLLLGNLMKYQTTGSESAS